MSHDPATLHVFEDVNDSPHRPLHDRRHGEGQAPQGRPHHLAPAGVAVRSTLHASKVTTSHFAVLLASSCFASHLRIYDSGASTASFYSALHSWGHLLCCLLNYAAGGFIVRTKTEKSLAAACFNLDITTVPVAEVIALRNSLIYVKNQGLFKIEIEGDSKLVIDVVNEVLSPPWKLLKFVQNIKALSSSFKFVKFKHVFREVNFVANALVNLGYMVHNMNMWEECAPQRCLQPLFLML
ncbi:hypothetical protein ACLB2K_018916 [Fragaria x ananassa]